MAPAHAATCTVTAALLNFGQYNGLTSLPTDVPGLIRVSCAKDPLLVTEVVTMTLQLLPSAPGVGASRKLESGAAALPFDMYTDALRTRLWGDGLAGTFTISGALTLTAVNTAAVINFPVYGRIRTGIARPVGSYTGQLAIALTY